MESIANLFNVLIEISDGIEKEKELRELFNTIIFEWKSIDDIDFSIISEEILLELLEHSEYFSNLIINNINGYKSLFDNLWKAQRKLKKRLL